MILSLGGWICLVVGVMDLLTQSDPYLRLTVHDDRSYLPRLG